MAANSYANLYQHDEQLDDLYERQRLERLYGSLDDEEEEENLDVVRRPLTRPAIPDLRFENQFNNSVNALQSQGATKSQIFFSVVIKDQLILPFISGFSWCLCSHLWRWWRVRGKHQQKESSAFWRGMKHGISKWCSSVYATFVNLPALTSQPKPAQS
ncbi:hypothetical protein EC973_001597 [Apophysomyces ossiformis]|uniref:Uncharacterized protein n=1 Tax=Apophysomyces ossiformis TaxID=679940 RepID=A0A8H7BNR8_9FUNG|nr:hypothetical protein EC973_001597 [Apophysomyces ossiformis]